MKSTKSLFFTMIIIGIVFALTGCSANGQQDGGFFQNVFVETFASAIHGIAVLFNGNFGLAIILLTLIIRLLLLPLMLKQFKNQQVMKEKMEGLKPELTEIQTKIKNTQEPDKQKHLQQEMIGLYKKHGVNPLSMGCLPMLIQMPILMGFYYAIRGSEEIATHSFLWFNLGHPDIWMTAAAGIVYYFQFKVSQLSLPVEQQKQMKMMGLISPIMIVFVSLNAPAALPLYWTAGGLFLIFQSLYARRIYKSNPIKSVHIEKN